LAKRNQSKRTINEHCTKDWGNNRRWRVSLHCVRSCLRWDINSSLVYWSFLINSTLLSRTDDSFPPVSDLSTKFSDQISRKRFKRCLKIKY
jgi:hypothetical protein